MRNKFAGTCDCGVQVLAGAGAVRKVNGRWTVSCLFHEAGASTNRRSVPNLRRMHFRPGRRSYGKMRRAVPLAIICLVLTPFLFLSDRFFGVGEELAKITGALLTGFAVVFVFHGGIYLISEGLVRLYHDRRGMTALEYALIGGFIMVAIVAGIADYATSLGAWFSMISSRMAGI